MFSKVQEQATSQSRQDARQYRNKPEGAISIDYMPPPQSRKGNADKLGDFVDYEEIK